METCKKGELHTSLLIATIALFSYSASYFARGVLGVVKVEMEEAGIFTGPQIGMIISVAMFAYAIAQLATGVMGDFIKSKYMISGGLLLSGLATLVIPIPIPGGGYANAGDIVLLVKTDKLETGDLCAFYYSNKILIKRVIATPGDYLWLEDDGTVFLNGTELQEPYLTEKALGECDISFPYQNLSFVSNYLSV